MAHSAIDAARYPIGEGIVRITANTLGGIIATEIATGLGASLIPATVVGVVVGNAAADAAGWLSRKAEEAIQRKVDETISGLQELGRWTSESKEDATSMINKLAAKALASTPDLGTLAVLSNNPAISQRSLEEAAGRRYFLEKLFVGSGGREVEIPEFDQARLKDVTETMSAESSRPSRGREIE
jgi:hypothetical protein